MSEMKGPFMAVINAQFMAVFNAHSQSTLPVTGRSTVHRSLPVYGVHSDCDSTAIIIMHRPD